MFDLRVLVAVVAASFMSGTVVLADSPVGPSESPPSGFDGTQFVDSEGCAFMRADISGSTVWVPRVDENRLPICGMDPTLGGTVVAATTAPVVMTEPTAPAPETEPPINTVATLTTPAARTAPADPRPATPRAASPAVAAATVAPPEPRRMTLAQICAETAATGQIFINQATGQPVVCATSRAVVAASAPATATAEPLRLTLADACALSVQTGLRYRNAATGDLIVCPDMTVSPGFNTQVVAPSAIARSYWSFSNPFGARIPVSNPTGIVQAYSGPPPGYEAVWTDGQMNIDRGFPPLSAMQMQARLAESQNGVIARMSTQGVPPGEVMPSTGDLFVQVGTFGNPANAQRAVATLQGLGLPVDIGTMTRNGAALQVVAAGPFASDAELQAALRAARGAGYGDAFTRN
jgi:hypothetical protein